MRFTSLLILSSSALLCGFILYGYRQGWIIIKYPKATSLVIQSPQKRYKKTVSLYFWHNEKWHKEMTTLLWSEIDESNNLYLLINAWLTLIGDEKIIEKQIDLQSAILSPSGTTLYLSFTANPLPENSSTYNCWMLLEGLLKTIREHTSHIQEVCFLVNHQAMSNAQLDFKNPWPIHGFLKG
jgi:hypothetical protein